jgi:hypothetical protein
MKRFLGGFSAKPEGLTFKIPVEAWIPVPALDPYEIPVQLNVRLNEGTYRYSSSTLEYDGSLHMIKLELEHFSDETIGGLSPEQFDLMCTSCGTFDSGVCESFDALQPACCMLPPALRTPSDNPSCVAATGCECCREKRMVVTTVDTEITGAGCQVLGSDIKITYPDCPGSPTETDSVTEQTCADLTLELMIKPLIMDLPVNQVKTFSATATGKRGPATVFQDVTVFPIWKSDQPFVANFVDQKGSIRGIATNPTPVTVRASVSESSGVEKTALVNVFCQGCTVEIQAATSVPLGGSQELTAIVKDSQGAAVSVMPATLSWESSDPAVASLNLTTGQTVTLQANTIGSTVITATYKDVYEQHSAFQGITVTAFAGKWDTYWFDIWGNQRYSPMLLTVSGTDVTGRYRYADATCGGTTHGTIDGQVSVDGYVLTGTWSEICLDQSYGGTFEFRLSPDGNSFTGWGKWPLWESSWNGVRRQD